VKDYDGFNKFNRKNNHSSYVILYRKNIWLYYLDSFLLSLFKVYKINRHSVEFLTILSYLLVSLGLIIAIISLINLGSSTRLGLPFENTTLKSNGLYKISRNPMYLGFDLFTLSSIIYIGNIFIATLGIYSLFIYHFIIIGEEKYLEKRFGKKYIEYRKKVRRYI